MTVLAWTVTASISAALAWPARWLAEKARLAGGPRALPATGGLAVIGAWWLAVLASGAVTGRALIGLALAMLPLVTIGILDIRRHLGPLPQLLAQGASAALAVFVGGVAARYVTNPLGGLLTLNRWEVVGLPLVGGSLTLLWILLLMNAINFQDGMDGLAGAVSAIGFITIGVVSLLPHVSEPHVALPAFLAAAAIGGFLFWNVPPARLTLGTPGAWFLGFLLAVLSVQGSSKVATLSVVGAIPLLDAAAVVLSRIRKGASPFRGDSSHLHHLLTARGWTPRAILGFYGAASIFLAAAAVLLPTPAKIALVAASSVAVVFLTVRSSRRR